jgi:hypothetical protein
MSREEQNDDNNDNNNNGFEQDRQQQVLAAESGERVMDTGSGDCNYSPDGPSPKKHLAFGARFVERQMIQKQRRKERYFQEDSDDEQECGNS